MSVCTEDKSTMYKLASDNSSDRVDIGNVYYRPIAFYTNDNTSSLLIIIFKMTDLGPIISSHSFEEKAESSTSVNRFAAL